MSSILPRISLEALLVKVTVKIEWGFIFSAFISQATLCAMTLVLPDPAPARTSKFFDSEVTAFLWGSLRLSKISDTSTYLFYQELN